MAPCFDTHPLPTYIYIIFDNIGIIIPYFTGKHLDKATTYSSTQ